MRPPRSTEFLENALTEQWDFLIFISNVEYLNAMNEKLIVQFRKIGRKKEVQKAKKEKLRGTAHNCIHYR